MYFFQTVTYCLYLWRCIRSCFLSIITRSNNGRAPHSDCILCHGFIIRPQSARKRGTLKFQVVNEISTSFTWTFIYRLILMVLAFMDTSKYFIVYVHFGTSCLFYRMTVFKFTYWHILLFLPHVTIVIMNVIFILFYCMLCQKWRNKDVQSIINWMNIHTFIYVDMYIFRGIYCAHA